MLRMIDPDRHGEILMCAAPIPLDQGRQAHVPLWAPVMVDAGIFSERVCRAARAKVDAFGTLVPVGGSHGFGRCRMSGSKAAMHRSGLKRTLGPVRA